MIAWWEWEANHVLSPRDLHCRGRCKEWSFQRLRLASSLSWMYQCADPWWRLAGLSFNDSCIGSVRIDMFPTALVESTPLVESSTATTSSWGSRVSMHVHLVGVHPPMQRASKASSPVHTKTLRRIVPLWLLDTRKCTKQAANPHVRLKRHSVSHKRLIPMVDWCLEQHLTWFTVWTHLSPNNGSHQRQTKKWLRVFLKSWIIYFLCISEERKG